MMDFDYQYSSCILILMWQAQNDKNEKNDKKTKSWLEWLFG